MSRAIILLLILIPVSCFSRTPEVSHVVTHNRTTIVCNQATGEKAFVKWGLFPSEKQQIRKITMHVTLGSPDSILTAHWDYLDHIRILRKGGANGTTLNYELGRMLTPYGSIYGKGWSWTWDVDVTDFSPFLRDSVEIEYIHSGYEAETVGWALTIDFEIVAGPPVADFLGVTPLWNGRFKYGDPKEKIEESILPVRFTTADETAISRIRIQHTGHGMDSPRGCSEFCSRWRQLMIDGSIVDHRYLWKDCGANPLYPQGGTWVYDRAYWCPGDLQTPDIIDVAASAGDHTVSLVMEPYTATENINAFESVAAYLFQYSKPNKKIDAAIEKIIVPNNSQQYSRFNPASFNPRFVIRNCGSENLHTVTVTYGTEGFVNKTFVWNGNLKFNETAEILIPGEIKSHEGENFFTISLSRPNGGKDGWAGDNELTSVFTAPEDFPSDFIVQFKTNNRPGDNRIFLINNELDTVFVRIPDQTDSNTIFIDTIHLNAGKYEFFLTDSAGDGLEFWAEPQYGDGYLRLFDMKDNLIHAFESDCGNGQKLSFSASAEFVTDTIVPKYAFSLYPRLVTGSMELSVVSNRTSDMTVIITVGGKIYEKHDYFGIKNTMFEYNLDHMPAGRIVVEVLMDGVSRFKGRVNKSIR